MTQIREIAGPVALPNLVGRIAILGGLEAEKTAVCVGLAVHQRQHGGTVLCLDARRSKQTEVQFRLLVRDPACYVPIPPSRTVPAGVRQHALKTVSQGLKKEGPPPLLLCDGIPEQSEWEQNLSFFLKAGATLVEFLRSASALVFGRYDTVILLRATAETAEALSRAVGRKIAAEDLLNLKSDEGMLIHRLQVYRVILPRPSAEDS